MAPACAGFLDSSDMPEMNLSELSLNEKVAIKVRRGPLPEIHIFQLGVSNGKRYKRSFNSEWYAKKPVCKRDTLRRICRASRETIFGEPRAEPLIAESRTAEAESKRANLQRQYSELRYFSSCQENLQLKCIKRTALN